MSKIDLQGSRRLDSRLAAVLAYLLGIVSGALLLMVERQDRFVRLHAFQSIVFSAIAGIILGTVILAGPMWSVALLGLAAAAVWAYLIFRAARGDWYELPLIGAWAERSV